MQLLKGRLAAGEWAQRMDWRHRHGVQVFDTLYIYSHLYIFLYTGGPPKQSALSLVRGPKTLKLSVCLRHKSSLYGSIEEDEAIRCECSRLIHTYIHLIPLHPRLLSVCGKT